MRPSFSRAFSSASSLRQDVLGGFLLSLGAVLLLVTIVYLFLVLRGTFGDPSVPRTLGLVVFALLHGGSASVSVPPVPALLGIGGSAELGLPVSSFVLLPFVLLLVSSRYVARRARSGAAFALATTAAYALVVGLLAALGGGAVEVGEAAVEFEAGPLSAAASAFLWAGIATALGVSFTRGPLLPSRVRQVVRGSLAAIGVSVVLTLILAVLVALVQGIDMPAPEAPPEAPSEAPAAPEEPTVDAEGGSARDTLSLLGGLMLLAPSALGTLWLLAHGVPVGVQDAAALSSLPLVGPALADAPLRVGLLGTYWPFGFAWRLLLLGPLIGLVLGGMLAARGAPRAERWWLGAMIAVPYTLVAALVAVLARLTADLTLAGASLSVSFGASLPWLLCLLPAGGLLGALGGHAGRFGDEEVPAARPRRAFLATTAVSTVVLLLSLLSLLGPWPPGGQELLGSAAPGDAVPDLPASQADIPAPEEPTPPAEPEAAPPEQPDGGQAPGGLGEGLTVGEAEWVVVSAKKKNELMPQGSGAVRQGDFVVVNLEFTNRSDEPVTIRPSSMGLIGKSGRRFEVMADMEGFVPPDRDPFSRPVDPGATLAGRAIFAVTPKASGLRLQLGDGQPFPPENAYVDVGL